jgi:hypothetical protein
VIKLETERFRVVTDRPVVTFVDASTTLDYILFSSDLNITDDGWKIEEALNCQHPDRSYARKTQVERASSTRHMVFGLLLQ